MEAAALILPLALVFLWLMLSWMLHRRSRRASADDPAGVAIYRGEATDCRRVIDILAEAGVAAWREGETAVHVAADRVAEVAALLRRQGEAPVEAGRGSVAEPCLPGPSPSNDGHG